MENMSLTESLSVIKKSVDKLEKSQKHIEEIIKHRCAIIIENNCGFKVIEIEL